MKYELLLFDADDTLFDFKAAELQALRQTLNTFDIQYIEATHLPLYHEINKPLWQAAEAGTLVLSNLNEIRFTLFAEKLNLSVDGKALASTYVENLSAASILFANSYEVIETLSKKYKLGILTNGLTKIQEQRIVKSTIGRFFEAFLISESIGISKPDARFFDIALDTLNHADKSTVLMIGDSLSSDIKGGLNFGIDTCWYNPKHLPNSSELSPTYEIADLSELLTLLTL